MIVSSAYWIIGKSLEAEHGIGRLKIPWEWALFTIYWSNSAAMTNRRGDKGSPCLTPLLHWNSFPGVPFKRIAEVPVSKILLTQLHQVDVKPRWCSMHKMVLCSIVSKAFSKSSLRMIISCLEYWHWWMYSNDQARQSCIVLFFMNPYWFWWTRGIITLCSRSDMILVNSFKTEFRREMGLKSLTELGLLHLGIRVMNELLMAFRSRFPAKNSLQRSYMSFLIMCQHFLKNRWIHPGLGTYL